MCVNTALPRQLRVGTRNEPASNSGPLLHASMRHRHQQLLFVALTAAMPSTQKTHQLVYVNAMQQAPVNPDTPVLKLEGHVGDGNVKLLLQRQLLLLLLLMLLVARIASCCCVWPPARPHHVAAVVVVLRLMLMLPAAADR